MEVGLLCCCAWGVPLPRGWGRAGRGGCTWGFLPHPPPLPTCSHPCTHLCVYALLVPQMELKDFELRKSRGELVTTHKSEQRRIAMQTVRGGVWRGGREAFATDIPRGVGLAGRGRLLRWLRCPLLPARVRLCSESFVVLCIILAGRGRGRDGRALGIVPPVCLWAPSIVCIAWMHYDGAPSPSSTRVPLSHHPLRFLRRLTRRVGIGAVCCSKRWCSHISRVPPVVPDGCRCATERSRRACCRCHTPFPLTAQ